MSKDELRNALIAKNIIDDAGKVNAITVNCKVRDLLLNVMDAMEELLSFLNEVYEKEQYDILIGALKIIYNFCGLPIPDAVQMIFICDEKKPKAVYLYEFLEDFQDIMYDFRIE